MATDSHSLDVLALISKTKELVDGGNMSARGEIEVQEIIIGDNKYKLIVVIEFISKANG